MPRTRVQTFTTVLNVWTIGVKAAQYMEQQVFIQTRTANLVFSISSWGTTLTCRRARDLYIHQTDVAQRLTNESAAIRSSRPSFLTRVGKNVARRWILLVAVFRRSIPTTLPIYHRDQLNHMRDCNIRLHFILLLDIYEPSFEVNWSQPLLSQAFAYFPSSALSSGQRPLIKEVNLLKTFQA